jgi:hypothetical protein
LVRTLGRRPHSYDRRGKPTGITREAAEDAARSGGIVDFEVRQARVVRLNVKSSIGAPHSVVLVLDLGDERLELSGYFSGSGEFIETSRKPID